MMADNFNSRFSGLLIFLVIYTGIYFIFYLRDYYGYYFITIVTLILIFMIMGIEDRFVRNTLFAALLIRLLFAVIQAYTSINLPGAGVDSATFEKNGWQFTEYWLGRIELEQVRIRGAFLYPLSIGIIYYIFGRVPLIPQYMNVLLGFATVYLIYLHTYLLTKSRKKSHIALCISAFFPTLIIFSAILLREAIIIFFLVLSFYLLILWLERGNNHYLISSFLAVAVVSVLHGTLIFIGVIHLILIAFHTFKYGRVSINYRQIIIGILLIAAAYLFIEFFVSYKMPDNPLNLFSLEHFQKYVGERKVGRTQYLQELIPHSYFDILWQTPIRAIYFLYTPFPGMIENIFDLLLFFEVLLYLMMSIYAFIGIWKLYKRNRLTAVSILFIALALITMYSWGTVNYGTAWRHRAKVVPFFIVAAPIGIERVKKHIFGKYIQLLMLYL